MKALKAISTIPVRPVIGPFFPSARQGTGHSTMAYGAEKTTGEVVDDNWLHGKVKTELVGHGSSNIDIATPSG